ncbi:MAG: hypothetical protein OXL96_24695 [Candidatus Poribacteria bacterium]|nr:hypothetical protein [Candidatus Poribacteria bacterium]
MTEKKQKVDKEALDRISKRVLAFRPSKHRAQRKGRAKTDKQKPKAKQAKQPKPPPK